MLNNIGVDLTTVFKIYFDKIARNYYLLPAGDEEDSIVFVKLDNILVIVIYLYRKLIKNSSYH